MRSSWLGVLSVVALLAASMAGCNTSGCLDNQSSIPLAGFYSSESGEAVALDSLDIGGTGAPDDSLLVKAGTAVSSVYLPLRFSDTSTEFFIRYRYPELGIDSPEYDDVISLTYSSEPYFVSEECGAMYRYRITGMSYTTNLIDSVVVTDSLITNTDIERLRIYFKVSDLEPEPEPEPDSGSDSDTDSDSDSERTDDNTEETL